jgi:molybdenum ABC transporter molybdate-binding protein
MSAELSWMDDWAVGLRVWVERAGRAVLGHGRLELLEEIDRSHSISAAARHVGMSYRHAWVQVQEINQAAGEPLVVASTGGSHGGGARLTPHGRLAVAAFRALQQQMERAAVSLMPVLLSRTETSSLHVMAAVSLEEVLGQLLTDYSLRQPKMRVRVVFGASDELADQILGGALADLFLTADPRELERLEERGFALPGTSTRLASNSLAAIAQQDRVLNVRRPADLLRPEVARMAIAVSSTPLGSYSRAYLEELGLYDALIPRAVLVDNSQAVVAAVRAGQAEAGLVYSTAATSVRDCRLLFRARQTPEPIRYAGAVVCRGTHPKQARDLLAFLTSQPAVQRFRRCGFLSAHGRVLRPAK